MSDDRDRDKPERPDTPEAPPETKVQVRAIRPHSYDGKDYEEGDTYDAPESQLVNLLVQRMAARVDVPQDEKDARERALRPKPEQLPADPNRPAHPDRPDEPNLPGIGPHPENPIAEPPKPEHH